MTANGTANGRPNDDPVIERARELVTLSLHAAVREDWGAARDAMQALSDETGSDGILFALMRLCDTIIGHQLRMRGLPPDAWDGGVKMGWLNTDDGTLGHAGQVPDAVRWAGQLVGAKAAKDEAAFRALMAVMPADGNERGRYVAALLESCAITVKMNLAGGRS